MAGPRLRRRSHLFASSGLKNGPRLAKLRTKSVGGGAVQIAPKQLQLNCCIHTPLQVAPASKKEKRKKDAPNNPTLFTEPPLQHHVFLTATYYAGQGR